MKTTHQIEKEDTLLDVLREQKEMKMKGGIYHHWRECRRDAERE